MAEYVTNPRTVISRGNIIGDDLGYLETIGMIKGVNCEITPSTININEQNLNAVLMSPVMGQLIVLYAETFRNHINTVFGSGKINLSGNNLSGSVMSRTINIFDRQEKITDNILPVEVSNPLIMPNNTFYSNSTVIIQDNKYIINAADIIYFFGEYTNLNYLKIDSEEIYTFSFFANNVNNIKLIAKFYDLNYNLIDSVESDELTTVNESRLYLSVETPTDTEYTAFELITGGSAEIYQPMLNKGNLKGFVSGYGSEIKNILFVEYDEIRIAHTAATPYGTNILYDVYNNGVLYEQNLLSPFILETADLGVIEIKANLLRNSSSDVVSLENLIITGV